MEENKTDLNSILRENIKTSTIPDPSNNNPTIAKSDAIEGIPRQQETVASSSKQKGTNTLRINYNKHKKDVEQIGATQKELQAAAMIAQGESLKIVAAQTGFNYSLLRGLATGCRSNTRIKQALVKFKEILSEEFLKVAPDVVERARSEIQTGDPKDALGFSKLVTDFVLGVNKIDNQADKDAKETGPKTLNLAAFFKD